MVHTQKYFQSFLKRYQIRLKLPRQLLRILKLKYLGKNLVETVL